MSLEPYPTSLRSRAVVLAGDNIDTDVITPIKRVVEGGSAFIDYAFEPLRFGSDGSSLATDPFADPERRAAEILIAGANFGCGSSRETAAVAVRGMGFRAVLAPSFGDIFYSNCLKNGVLPIRLKRPAFLVIKMAGENLSELVIDLGRQVVLAADQTLSFDIGPLQKEMLLRGWDDLGLMQTRIGRKAAFDEIDARLRPWVRERSAIDSTNLAG